MFLMTNLDRIKYQISVVFVAFLFSAFYSFKTGFVDVHVISIYK